MALDTRITLRKLEILSLVVHHRGFGRAAEQLYVAQPVVTAHIRSLEQRLGTKLFFRDGREMHLTEAGRVVFEWSEEVLRRTRELERHLASMSDGSQGTVALGASMSIGSYRLPRVLGRFRTEHPRADLRLSIFDSEHAIEGTRDGTLDFCVVVLDAEDEVPGMELEVLGYDELVVVGTPEATPDSGQVTVDEFARLPFIEVPDGIVRRSFVDRHLRRIGVKERNIVLQLGHPEAMKRATREGLGVALMFRSAVQDELDQGVLREVQVQGADLWVPIFLVSRKGKTFSPLHRGLIAAIREELDSSAIQQPAKAVITA